MWERLCRVSTTRLGWCRTFLSSHPLHILSASLPLPTPSSQCVFLSLFSCCCPKGPSMASLICLSCDLPSTVPPFPLFPAFLSCQCMPFSRKPWPFLALAPPNDFCFFYRATISVLQKHKGPEDGSKELDTVFKSLLLPSPVLKI